MKKLIALFVLFTSLVSHADLERRILTTEEFTELEASGDVTIFIRQGTSYEVVATGESDDLNRLEAEVEDGTLSIHSSGSSWGISGSSEELRLFITIVNLTGIEISGAVELETKNTLRLNSMDLKAYGACEILLTLTTDAIDIETMGASEVELHGSARTAQIESAGASELEAQSFEVEEMEISLTGASEADLYVTRSLKVTAHGVSEVTYRGDPKLESNISAASSLSKS